MISLDSIHIPTAGISIMVKTGGKQSTIVFAFCNPKDSFNKKSANKILKGRLETNRDPIKLEYIGNTPRKDVLFPVADFVRDHLGFTFDADSKHYFHPETFGMPNGVLDEMDVFEPNTQVSRSVTQTMVAILNFIAVDLQPQLSSGGQQARISREAGRIAGSLNPNGVPIGKPTSSYSAEYIGK